MTVEPANMLCCLDDIEDGGSQRFTAEICGQPTAVLVVRQADRAFAYVNSCPHIGAPLDFLPGKFLNAQGTHIQCANHGALFRIEDGLCVSGPCMGASLTAVKTVVEDRIVRLQE
ncbi:MAG: Rieske (2Fe-2S) protein [Rhodospirillales bacterium]|nr:Rieske (2Fe-2S) protein [Rhodospirillales bacterium]